MRGYGRQKKNEKKEKLNRVWPAKISLYPIPNLYFLLLYPIPNLYVILLCLILSLYFRMLISAYSHNRTKASINFRFKRFLHYCTFFSFFKKFGSIPPLLRGSLKSRKIFHILCRFVPYYFFHRIKFDPFSLEIILI